ncbi:MAG: hypothetical protein FWD06_04135 [Oscillospiraceae bacterium]|nr:hypothetical protein [Oscillospiraceae bacterium]
MTIKPITAFGSISQRVVHGLNLIYSDFASTLSKNTSEQSQRKLHELMGMLIDKLYERPELLNLTGHKDEAYQSYEVNNMKPELDKVYQSIFKALFEFYKFLYISTLHGEVSGKHLAISNATLKENKATYKPLYKTLLNELGIEVEKSKTDISITAESEFLQSLKLLAENVPVNINKWTPYVLANFACCSFANDFSYLLQRADKVNGLNGLLFDLQRESLDKGYTQSCVCSMTATSIDFNISFKNAIGGFLIGYNPRKYQPFYFGTINGIGEKAMLDDFDNLDKDLQEHFINICRTCNSCLGCTKGGKNKIFAINVTHDGKDYNLCPCFPRHSWDTIDRGLMDILFKYHDAQEKYGTDWKKK